MASNEEADATPLADNLNWVLALVLIVLKLHPLPQQLTMLTNPLPHKRKFLIWSRD